MDEKPLVDFMKTMDLNMDLVPDTHIDILIKIIHQRVWQYILHSSTVKSKESVPSNELLVIDTYIQMQTRRAIYGRRTPLGYRDEYTRNFTKLKKLQYAFLCRLNSICQFRVDLISHPDGVINARIRICNCILLYDVILYHDETLHIKKNLEDCGCALIRMLIDEGSDINALDAAGECPLSAALYKSTPDILKMLLDTGRAEANSKTFDGETVISRIRYDKENPENFELCLQILKENGFGGNMIGEYGNSPMHHFLEDWTFPFLPFDPIKSFIELFNPNLGMKNFYGLTPLHIFIQNAEDEEI